MKTQMMTASFGTALLALASFAQAQTMSVSYGRSYSYGNSTAGATAYVGASQSAALTRVQTSSGSSGGSIYSWRPATYEDRLTASARGEVHADVRFLGQRTRAGHFRMTLSATGQTGSGWLPSCTSSGTIYLKIGSNVLWNSSFNTTFSNSASLRIRLMAPTMYVGLGAGIARLSGSANGAARASIRGTLDPCAGRVEIGGEAAVSGDASATASVYTLLLFANVNATFYAREQELEANNLRAQPGIGMPYTWGRTGTAVFRSGEMHGYIRASGALPPYVPISRTLVNWTKSATVRRIL